MRWPPLEHTGDIPKVCGCIFAGTLWHPPPRCHLPQRPVALRLWRQHQPDYVVMGIFVTDTTKNRSIGQLHRINQSLCSQGRSCTTSTANEHIALAHIPSSLASSRCNDLRLYGGVNDRRRDSWSKVRLSLSLLRPLALRPRFFQMPCRWIYALLLS